MNEEKINEGIIKNSYELIIKEFQSLITVFYLILVGIGMDLNARLNMLVAPLFQI